MSEAVLQFVNPADLSLLNWAIFFGMKSAGLFLLDYLIDRFVVLVVKPKKLPYRIANPNVKGLVKLESKDYYFLIVNQFVEYVFVSHVFVYMFTSENVSRTLSELTILNTLPALFLLFVIDDFFYAFLHKFMHWKMVYGYIHKHHHRQILPRRGYTDAGNEHPLEQIAAQFLLWYTIKIVVNTTGLHVIALFVHFILYAALALLNHTEYDVRFNLLGFEYSVRAHEMHHRQPDCNMAQYCMIWDKLMGTYREYTDGTAKST